MEIKINKEIRAYRETLFFGLSVRQFVCSVLAVGVAVTLYFSLSVGPGNGELGVHCRRGSRGRCRIFSVQRSHVGTVFMGVAEIGGHHGGQARLEVRKLL